MKRVGILIGLLLACTAWAEKRDVDLESHLYDLSAAADNFTEALAEVGSDSGELYTTALQVRRNSSRLHESLLRGMTLKCLRNEYTRIDFHIKKMQQQCQDDDSQDYLNQIDRLAELGRIVDRDITELELVWGEPSRPVAYWQCESVGYKFGFRYGGYIGRAVQADLAMKRALTSCENSPKLLRRCKLESCILKDL